MAERCIICGVDNDRHAPCAVCESSNETVKLCAFCRDDPANEEWNTTTMITPPAGDERREQVTARVVLVTADRRRGRPRDPLLDSLILPMLVDRSDQEIVARIDWRGRRRGSYSRRRYTSRREIARRAGCSCGSVSRRMRDYISDSRARVSRSVQKLQQ
jgi:hypothetical protein